MPEKSIRPTLRTTALIAGAIAPFAAVAQNAAAPKVVEVEQIVVTGTRVPDRSATETAVPVDVDGPAEPDGGAASAAARREARRKRRRARPHGRAR